MELIITPDIEQALVEQATQLGISPEQLALGALRREFVTEQADAVPHEDGETLADFLGDSIGVLHSNEQRANRVEISTNDGQTFAALLAEKRRQGRL